MSEKRAKFEGAMTALVTPLREGAVDEGALEELVERQLAAGIDALVPCGTTGESATLTADEHERVVRRVVATARGRVPVIAGAGSNSTAEAIERARACQRAGADGLLVVTPYYNKPTQEGLYRHFHAVAGAVPLPIVLYNVPGRTGVDLTVDTVARLAEHPSFVAIKEATGLVTRTQQIIERLGPQMPVLSGEDALNYPLFAVGARGCISVVSNAAPALVAELWDSAARGDHARALELHLRSLPLAEVLFVESNPIPVKHAVSLLLGGRALDDVRLPLVPCSPALGARISAVLARLELL